MQCKTKMLSTLFHIDDRCTEVHMTSEFRCDTSQQPLKTKNTPYDDPNQSEQLSTLLKIMKFDRVLLEMWFLSLCGIFQDFFLYFISHNQEHQQSQETNWPWHKWRGVCWCEHESRSCIHLFPLRSAVLPPQSHIHRLISMNRAFRDANLFTVYSNTGILHSSSGTFTFSKGKRFRNVGDNVIWKTGSLKKNPKGLMERQSKETSVMCALGSGSIRW